MPMVGVVGMVEVMVAVMEVGMVPGLHLLLVRQWELLVQTCITDLHRFTTLNTMRHLKELLLTAPKMVCTIPKLRLALAVGNKWLIDLTKYVFKDEYDLIFN